MPGREITREQQCTKDRSNMWAGLVSFWKRT